MDIYSECIKYLRNGFLKCLCTILTNDPSTQTPSNIPASQYPNEFDIPGSKSFNERWHNKLKIDRLVRNSSESEKQFLFLIHLIVG
ncbi:unnamed protein product [Trichobilharzia regenti]|nr:unnamed protein product [Trichobilharzia regenti]